MESEITISQENPKLRANKPPVAPPKCSAVNPVAPKEKYLNLERLLKLIKQNLYLIPTILIFSTIAIPPIEANSRVKVGAECNQIGKKLKTKSITLTCQKSGKKSIWTKNSSQEFPSNRPKKQVDGLFVKEVGGGEITNLNSDLAFDPASSLKTLVALYAFNEITLGNISLQQTFPSIKSPDPHGCSKYESNASDTFRLAIKQMMQISDNNRTTSLIQYFTVKKINAFAKSIGLKDTSFKVVSEKPGFIPIGCVDPQFDPINPTTVSGNYSSLRDLTKIWEFANNLKEPLRQQFMELTAGRKMFDTEGYDYSGIWPELEKIAKEESPPNLANYKLNQFINLMDSNTKGGSNALCYKTENCTYVRWWVSMINLTKIPVCLNDGKLSSRSYVWGYFTANSDSNSAVYEPTNPALKNFLSVKAEPMREQIRNSLKNWNSCIS